MRVSFFVSGYIVSCFCHFMIPAFALMESFTAGPLFSQMLHGLQIFLRWRPVVSHHDARRALVGVEVEPMVRVVGIARGIYVAHHVFLHERVWLCAEGIYSGRIIHVFGVVVYEVALHPVVCHGAWLLVPSPSHADARIGNF